MMEWREDFIEITRIAFGRSDLTGHLERCKGYASDVSKPSNKSSGTHSFIRTGLTRRDKLTAAQGTTKSSQLFFDINRISRLILAEKHALLRGVIY